MTTSENDKIKQMAAEMLLKQGIATLSEAAKLRGVSRQAMHQATATKYDTRLIRRKYLGIVWKELLERLTA